MHDQRLASVMHVGNMPFQVTLKALLSKLTSCDSAPCQNRSSEETGSQLKKTPSQLLKPPLLGVRTRDWAIKSILGHRTGSDVKRNSEVHWELSWVMLVTKGMKGTYDRLHPHGKKDDAELRA